METIANYITTPVAMTTKYIPTVFLAVKIVALLHSGTNIIELSYGHAHDASIFKLRFTVSDRIEIRIKLLIMS